MPQPTDLSPLERAVMETVTYADIFNFPLTVEEIQTYLVGVQATCSQVESALRQLTPTYLEHADSYVFLPGRRHIIDSRAQREQASAAQWKIARHYGTIIARLPFVRMVAVTGALAVNNAPIDDDIDYLIVTKPGHLWVTRAMVIALVRWAARSGITLCPNFFLAEDHLAIPDHNLFTAHELAQMVPLTGHDTHQAMLRANRWATRFLPNAPSLQGDKLAPIEAYPAQRVLEGLLSLLPLRAIERWERQRKIAKFTQQMAARGITPESAEACFSASCCRGHFDQHGSKTLALLDKRFVT